MLYSLKHFKELAIPFLGLTLLVAGCTGSQKTTQQNPPADQSKVAADEALHKNPSELDRLVPNPITNEIPNSFYEAMEKETRTMSGKPGENYWTQWATYDIDAELMPEDTLLKGSGTITYYNNSPDTLSGLLLELAQNLHKEGAQRSQSQEVTGGVNLHNIATNGTELSQLRSQSDPSGFGVNGTQLYIRPEKALTPGDSVTIQIEWDFKIPRQGASSRMGYNQGNLYYIAYWYPQMRVYDDVIGWMADQFVSNAEFYHDFANYNVDITVPEQWVVGSTGALTNGKKILRDEVYQRMQKAHSSDSVVQVVGKEDFGAVTKSAEDGTVTWNFKAENVRDFAFSVTKESMWDATRANIGDRDGDGQDDYSNINAIYRSSAPLWTNGAKFTQHSLSFLSDYTGLAYPWPHMTSVEGGGIIGGGMEFPMMTIIGDYNGQSAQSLYAVIAHELAHMWVPMIVSNNERRYAWMDEGTTTFNENQAKQAYYPDGPDFDQNEYESYLRIVGTGLEGPIMRWSDYHYNGWAYGTTSYSKPGSMLVALRNLLGEETFNKAYREFIDRWKYKHPYPWDLFNTFEDVSGQNLDWFWRSWYYEVWALDQAVGSIKTTDNSTRIVIEDRGQVPMPAMVEITMADGSTVTKTIPVDKWLRGATQTAITVKGKVSSVVIDPNKKYPDADRSNNSWQQ